MNFETLLTAERIAQHTADGHFMYGGITDYLDEQAAARPDRVAFVDGCREITYASLMDEVDRCARGLPERVEVLREFPTTASGRIQTSQLRVRATR